MDGYYFRCPRCDVRFETSPVPHYCPQCGSALKPGFTPEEVGSTYVTAERKDVRYVVSYIIGYGDGDVASPIEAAEAAYSYVTEECDGDEEWFVYDRKTKRMDILQLRKFAYWRDNPEEEEEV